MLTRCLLLLCYKMQHSACLTYVLSGYLLLLHSYYLILQMCTLFPSPADRVLLLFFSHNDGNKLSRDHRPHAHHLIKTTMSFSCFYATKKRHWKLFGKSFIHNLCLQWFTASAHTNSCKRIEMTANKVRRLLRRQPATTLFLVLVYVASFWCSLLEVHI